MISKHTMAHNEIKFYSVDADSEFGDRNITIGSIHRTKMGRSTVYMARYFATNEEIDCDSEEKAAEMIEHLRLEHSKFTSALKLIQSKGYQVVKVVEL